MTPIKRVLCPVDFSDFSRRAMDYAVAMAAWYSVPLVLLYVHHVPEPVPAVFAGLATGPEDGRVLSQADAEQLRQELRGLLPEGAATRLAIECLVVEGNPATEIVGEADAADLIVMGTHGRSGFEYLVIGSVADKVLRTARGPVLTIPRSAHDATTSVPSLFHQVLVAIDFSNASQVALEHAASLAGEADAHLTLLHVVEVPRYLARWMEQAGNARYLERWQRDALAELHDLVPAATREEAHVDERVEAGVAYREILRVAAEQHADLIVVGAHGAGVTERTFVGSTTQHIVRRAACPVLTVRGSGHHGTA